MYSTESFVHCMKLSPYQFMSSDLEVKRSPKTECLGFNSRVRGHGCAVPNPILERNGRPALQGFQ